MKKIFLSLSFISILFSCSSTKDNTSVEDNHNQEIVAEQKADGIYFNDKNNKVVALEDLKGKVVFINFWATWCPPCIREMPDLNELYLEFKDNPQIEFLFVDVDGNMEKSLKFMDKKGFKLPVYFPSSYIPEDFLSGAIPTTVILDKDGNRVGRIEGMYEYNTDEFKQSLKKLIEA